jgi:hypothetical protein
MFESKKIEKKLRNSFSNIKDELNDHLLAINENTNEIQANFEHLTIIENKVDKLAERIEEIQMILQEVGLKQPRSAEYLVQPLNEIEKIFILILLRMQEDKETISYKELKDVMSTSCETIGGYVTSLIHKGIPIVKRYIMNEPHIAVDQRFKEYQIKTNIINITEEITQKVRDKIWA